MAKGYYMGEDTWTDIDDPERKGVIVAAVMPGTGKDSRDIGEPVAKIVLQPEWALHDDDVIILSKELADNLRRQYLSEPVKVTNKLLDAAEIGQPIVGEFARVHIEGKRSGKLKECAENRGYDLIDYEYNEFGCVTDCPYAFSAHVGSMACSMCKYCKGYDTLKQIVKCSYRQDQDILGDVAIEQLEKALAPIDITDLKPGMKVELKTWEELVEEFEVDEIGDIKLDGICITQEMKNYCGQIHKIVRRHQYTFDICMPAQCTWPPEAIKRIIPEKMPKEITIDQLKPGVLVKLKSYKEAIKVSDGITPDMEKYCGKNQIIIGTGSFNDFKIENCPLFIWHINAIESIMSLDAREC